MYTLQGAFSKDERRKAARLRGRPASEAEDETETESSV